MVFKARSGNGMVSGAEFFLQTQGAQERRCMLYFQLSIPLCVFPEVFRQLHKNFDKTMNYSR